MKSSVRAALYSLSAVSLFLPVNYVFAAKPVDVISLSNGYPSGAHYNLNIHGKEAYTCDNAEGGNSVFISEHGDSTIGYITNRKSSVSELTVLDKCGEDFDSNSAKVQLPYESQGYYVFAVVKGKPSNGSDGEDSSVIMFPNLVTQACNDIDLSNPNFPTYRECPDDDLLVLGLIAGNNVYEATNAGLVRLGDEARGKSRATEITALFMWTGWVYDVILDTNGDGTINMDDVPLTYDSEENGGNGSGVIDKEEFEDWQSDSKYVGLARYYENEWILNIADLVATDQAISNDGTKLLKVRFYPVETSVYE